MMWITSFFEKNREKLPYSAESELNLWLPFHAGGQILDLIIAVIEVE